ncbi:MAG: hypothetical protein ACYCZY_09555 [Lacisediminihabitans sp.]
MRTRVHECVYYSGFWYTRYAFGGERAFSGRFVRSEIERHERHLRVLALAFPVIYIPRTHFLSHLSPVEEDIIAGVLNRRDAQFLVQRQVLQFSVGVGLDPQQDNERILSRRRDTKVVRYTNAKAVGDVINKAKLYPVVPGSEAAKNAESFPDYAKTLRVSSPSASRDVSSLIKRAHLRDIPFFHEAFVHGLREKLSAEDRELVWRAGNSIYLTTADPTDAGAVPYYDPEIESPAYRFEPWGLDRYLLHPESLYTLLGLILPETTLRVLEGVSIDQALSILTPAGTGQWMVPRFREDLFRLTYAISRRRHDPHQPADATQSAVRTLLLHELKGNLHRSVLDALEDARQAAEGGAEGTDALQRGLILAALRQVKKWIVKDMRRRLYPGLYDFAELLNWNLRHCSDE